jgi:hypothetical protein
MFINKNLLAELFDMDALQFNSDKIQDEEVKYGEVVRGYFKNILKEK